MNGCYLRARGRSLGSGARLNLPHSRSSDAEDEVKTMFSLLGDVPLSVCHKLFPDKIELRCSLDSKELRSD